MQLIRLSININKVALIRNARGGNLPDVVKFAIDCEKYGGQGITVHPRPDQRHITFRDVVELRQVVTTEFNVEGYPSDEFIELMLKVVPDQVTLVPDKPDQITSDHGWNTIENRDFLRNCITSLHQKGIRVSIFVDPVEEMIKGAKETGTDRIELYTEMYAKSYSSNRELAVREYVKAAEIACSMQLGINAGHDLNLDNLKYFNEKIDGLLEVSIGHALISDALYYGIENTIQLYLKELE